MARRQTLSSSEWHLAHRVLVSPAPGLPGPSVCLVPGPCTHAALCRTASSYPALFPSALKVSSFSEKQPQPGSPAKPSPALSAGRSLASPGPGQRPAHLWWPLHSELLVYLSASSTPWGAASGRGRAPPTCMASRRSRARASPAQSLHLAGFTLGRSLAQALPPYLLRQRCLSRLARRRGPKTCVGKCFSNWSICPQARYYCYSCFARPAGLGPKLCWAAARCGPRAGREVSGGRRP